MDNWTVAELGFRCERLSIRLEKLAQIFFQIAALSLEKIEEGGRAAEMADGAAKMAARVPASPRLQVPPSPPSVAGITIGPQAPRPEVVIELIRESKKLIELTAIDLDVDSAFELAQIQRQLSRWHIHWSDTDGSDRRRLEISNLATTWGNRIQEMAGALV